MGKWWSGFSGFRVSVTMLWPTLRQLRAMGADVEAIIESAALQRVQLEDPDVRVPFELGVQLSAEAAQAVGDPAFGLHLAELYRPGDFGVLDYLAHNSLTLGDALVRLCRYNRLLQDAAETVLELESERAIVSHRLLGTVWLPSASIEKALASLVVIGRQLTGAPLVPIEVQFRHHAPSYMAEHERIFRTKIVFDADRDAVILPARDLDLPLTNADPGLCSILDRHAQKLLAEIPPVSSFSARVRELVAAALQDESHSAQRIASKLQLSERTLRRRLRQDGTSYEQLLDELRRALTDRYLEHPALTVEDVALLLGYSDASAFRRAFRRWHGMSPVTYRKTKHSGAAHVP